MKGKWILAGVAVGVSVASTAVAADAPSDTTANAIRNADGTRTIPQGQHLPDANRAREEFCAQRGAVDITNQGEVTLGPGASDVVICGSPNSRGASTGAYVPQAQPGQSGTTIRPDTRLRPAPSTLPKGEP